MLGRIRKLHLAHPASADTTVALAWAVLLSAGTAAPALVIDTPVAGPVLLTLLTAVPLLWRTRNPVMVTLIIAALENVRLVLIDSDLQRLYPGSLLVALYTVAARSDRRTSWRTTAVVAVVTTTTVLIAWPGWLQLPVNLGLIPWMCLPTAIGDAVRSRREVLAAAVERAERAEQGREEEAARRVTEERMRIARELHDVVAHRITLINAQAGVAHHLMGTDPSLAYTALERIRDTSLAALNELRATVGLLRQPGEELSVEPMPGLDDLEELLERFRHAGLHVTLTRSGKHQPLPTTAGLTAYRIIQEALTNVQKHAGPTTARVIIHYTTHSLRITIEDEGNQMSSREPGGREQAPSANVGHGLIGMQERARALGGTLVAGPVAAPGTGFRVDSELPFRIDVREGQA